MSYCSLLKKSIPILLIMKFSGSIRSYKISVCGFLISRSIKSSHQGSPAHRIHDHFPGQLVTQHRNKR
jgi:hypothetical protein